MLRRIAPLVAVAALALIVPVVLAATPAHVLPSRRIDIKVLLVSADGTEPGFGAWKAELQREGVPYSTFVADNGQNRISTLTDDGLADYGANHAYYDAVILATGDLGHNVANANGTTSYLSALSDAEWATLAKFERTFGHHRGRGTGGGRRACRSPRSSCAIRALFATPSVVSRRGWPLSYIP
jgi:hypothetical protein